MFCSGWNSDTLSKSFLRNPRLSPIPSRPAGTQLVINLSCQPSFWMCSSHGSPKLCPVLACIQCWEVAGWLPTPMEDTPTKPSPLLSSEVDKSSHRSSPAFSSSLCTGAYLSSVSHKYSHLTFQMIICFLSKPAWDAWRLTVVSTTTKSVNEICGVVYPALDF